MERVQTHILLDRRKIMRSPYWFAIGLLTSSVLMFAQAPNDAPDTVAGISVNYDEARIGDFVLPDALILNDGQVVRDAKTWWKKRPPEIVAMFESQQYGRAPERPGNESFDVFDTGTPALNGKAIRKQVRIYLSKDKTGPRIQLLIYLPASSRKPVPMLLSINFGAVQDAVDDPGIKPETVWDPKTNTRITPQQGRHFGRLNVEPFLDAGIGVATFYYGDIDPDSPDGFAHGIRAHYLNPGQKERAADEWGSVAAWAWGMSRVED